MNLAFLARLAGRYATRHKGQTGRAILGLLIATTVLTTGLGMGESIGASLERVALDRYGPVDIVVMAGQPFDVGFVDELQRVAPAASGVATIRLAASAAHPANQLAESDISLRGVAQDEAAVLGALPRGVAEPQAGQVVISDELAASLEAEVGDTIELRASPPGEGPDLDTETLTLSGVTNTPTATATLDVREGALFLGVQVTTQNDGGTLTLEAVSPGGIPYANSSVDDTVRLFVPGPLESGVWTLRVTSTTPALFAGGAATGYLPAGGASRTSILASVSGIIPGAGRGGVVDNPVALVPLADLQRTFGLQGMATHAYFTVSGDARRAADSMAAAVPAERDDIRVDAAKLDTLDNAREAGRNITGFLLVMGGFTLLAGILLAYTLFAALVEERLSELGVMRALGLTRGQVALAMTLEGAIYTAGAALVGLALGMGLLTVLLAGLRRVATANGGPAFFVHVSPLTLATAFAIGTLLPLLTIAIGSLRFARLDPARAIRAIPDDPRGNRRTGLIIGIVLIALGTVASLAPVPRLVGVPLAFAGAAVLATMTRRVWPVVSIALVGVAATAVSLYRFDAFPDDRGELDPLLTLGRGAILALGIAALAVVSPAPYDWVTRAYRKLRPNDRAPFIAVRYFLARRRPVALTMAMVALVVVIVTVMGTLFSVFGGAIPESEAGYTVLAESNLRYDSFPHPLPPELADQVDTAHFVARHFEFDDIIVTVDGRNNSVRLPQLLGATVAFAEDNAYEITTRAARYGSDADAWRAVARDEAVMLPDFVVREHGLTPGDTLTLTSPGSAPFEVVLAGGFRTDFSFYAWLGEGTVDSLGFPVTTTVFLRPTGEPDELVRRLNAEYGADGLEFVSVPEEVARLSATIQTIILVFEAFLALGVFVGLAATGFLASRAVHERIREIGTLRALGYEESDIRRVFRLEGLITSFTGLVIGLSVGLLVAHSIWWRGLRGDGVAFRPPWLLILGFAAAVLLLSALASRGAADRAARQAPAIAVRHIE